MKKYEHMTKEELIKTLKEFSSEQNIKQSAYEDTLQELEAHQIELETQNREMQESRRDLEEANNRYALLYDFAPVGYCTLDKKGIIREINLTGAAMLGIERNRLSGMPFNMFVSKEDRGKFFSHLKKCEEHMDKVSTELYLKEKNGQTNWIELLSSPVEDPEKLMFRTIITDITGRKQAEEALRIKDARLTEAQRVAHIGSWELDVKSHELFWSAETFRIFGYKPDQFRPTMETFFENVHPDDRLLMNEVTQAAFYEKKPFDADHRIILPDGKECYVHERAEVIFDDGGQPVRMIGTVQDITGRRHAEEEQKKLQEQLTQAQKMESVGRLAGGVAHDFNNILGIIIGYAEMIMMDMEPDNPIYSHLQRILNTTQRAADLVRQLLAFARKQTASPEILNINETVANMFRMLKRIIGEDINLIWKPGHDIWKVRIDPVQIDQILANLAVNSRDAISNTGSITLETGNVVFDYAYSAGHAEILPGEFVLLEVSDTGSGMSKEVVEHIFEPFFTTKEIGKGTGLGLATVYGIVRQNNGFINVYSEEGKGTSFKIYLPRFKSDIIQSTVEKVSEKLQRGTETLLIAEDEKDYLMSCKIVLEKLGYTVFSAETPEQAITITEEHPGDIDLLITDVIMPKMNGKELLEKIHKIRPGLKCLYMSGYTANVIAHHGVLDEGVNFLQKPFSVKTIAEKVREVIDSK